MIKKVFIALFIVPLLSGCNDDGGDCCKTIEAVMFFNVTNSENLDLLNPNSGEIDTSLIKIFYKTYDNEMVEVNSPHLDVPKGYEIVAPEMGGLYMIKVYLNIDSIQDNVSYTNVQWSNDIMDEIKTEFDQSNNNVIAKKIWVNGQLKWENGSEELLIALNK